MRRLIPICVAVSLANFWANDCRSGTLQTSVNASAFDVESGDGDSESGSTVTSANYSNPHGGSASASASVGPLLADGKTSLTMKTFATATGGSGDEGQYIANRASASAFWDEEVKINLDRFGSPDGKTDVHLQFMFQLHGSKSGDATANFQFTTYDNASGEPLIQQTDPNVFDSDFPQNVPFLLISDALELTQSQKLSFSLNVHATGFGSGLGGPSTSTADYSHTVTLLSITPRDADGNFIPGVTIDSASGFDYNSLIVPEPSSLALVAMASTCLLLGRMFLAGTSRGGRIHHR